MTRASIMSSNLRVVRSFKEEAEFGRKLTNAERALLEPNPASSTEQATPVEEEAAEKKSAAAVLVDIAMERYNFGCTEEGEAFATPKHGGHIARMLRGGRSSLRAELSSAYRKETGRIAPQQALADA